MYTLTQGSRGSDSYVFRQGLTLGQIKYHLETNKVYSSQLAVESKRENQDVEFILEKVAHGQTVNLSVVANANEKEPKFYGKTLCGLTIETDKNYNERTNKNKIPLEIWLATAAIFGAVLATLYIGG